ncbi:MAG: hypothetical protein KDD48_07100, partial [Bdellovibrionales bacterium]|nr:hypothetical protein [Bdellovibrionales bacterium]
AIALEKDSVMNAFKKFDVQLFRADWTNQNGAITRALESYGRSSVPTNVILGPMGKEAKVLPTILTPFDVISNIEARSK